VNYNNGDASPTGATFVEIAGPSVSSIDEVIDSPFYELFIFNQEGDCIGYKEALVGVEDPSLGIPDFGFQTIDLTDSELPPEGFGLIVRNFLDLATDMVAFGGSDIITTGASLVEECDLTETDIAGMIIEDTGVAEVSLDEDGSRSLQRIGCGEGAAEFDCWVGPLESTKGAATVGQLIQDSDSCPDTRFGMPHVVSLR